MFLSICANLRRLYSLHRLAECAYGNLGRIRLVSGRLWAVAAPQLVSAACHRDPEVATLAVESLRQLSTKLLARAELYNFTHQVRQSSYANQGCRQSAPQLLCLDAAPCNSLIFSIYYVTNMSGEYRMRRCGPLFTYSGCVMHPL